MGDWLFAAGLLLAMLSVPAFVTVKMVAGFTGPKPFILRSPLARQKFARLPPEVAQFVAAQGLTLTDAYHYAQIPFAIFREPPGPPPERYLVVMLTNQKHVCDFVTNFSVDVSLTTTRGTHAFMFPRPPGSHLQGFSKLTLPQLWAKHLEGESCLLDRQLVTVQPDPTVGKDVGERIETAMRKQGALLKAIPRYWLKAIGWFYVKRFLMVNKTIAQQHAARGVQ